MKINTMINRSLLLLRKHSPELLLVGGVACTITGTVLACRAALDQDSIGLERSQKMKMANTKSQQIEANANYILSTTKNFGPAVAISALGYGMIFGGHHIIYARNIALGASLTALQSKFDCYRQQVVERHGEEFDQNIYNGIEEIEIEDKKVKIVDHKFPSLYAKFFDDCSPYWKNDADMNLSFLYDCQRFANDKLRANGHMFLNEVYDMIGIPRTKEGAVVGWVLDNFSDVSDNYISFGIYEAANYDKEKQMFINGYETSILLDFNVDGVIWDLI